ncbi:uncharacterized protein [Nicotiana tomentosiformis]|uniref:uncharacterized protein n=1 Tax=Nicotiana tomentosiformis TaxID=4098 RepID=UPI00388C9D8F
MDSGCSKHMTGSTNDFLSLKALQGGSVSFGNSKKGYILGVGRIGKSLSHSIENMYYVNGLKYSLLSISQIRDKGKKVEFVSKICTVTNLMTGEVMAGSYRFFVAEQIGQEGPGSWSTQVKLQGSQDLCGPMRVPSRGGKMYIFVIVDDYSRFTWTLFLRTKDGTFQVFAAFVKKIQVKMSNNVVCIRSDHRTEFDNAKFDEFCAENGITHNFLAPRTPQQKWCCREE